MAFTSNTYTATLDIKRRTPHRPLIIEGDAGVLLDLSLTDNGAAMDITGLYARCVFRRSDGRTVLVSESDDPCPMTVTKATGKIVITVPRTCFRDGDNFLQVQILDGDPDSGTCLSSTFPLLLRAYNCLLTNEAVEESVEFPILEWLIDALRNMTVTGVTIDPDDAGWPTATASLSLTDGAYRLTLGIPRGNGIASIVVDSSNPQLVITYEDGTVALAMLNGIASQTWVEAQDYIDTDELSAALTDYASKSYVAHEIAFSGHYTKPVGGIPASDLSDEVNASLDLADSAIQEADLEDYYQLPSGGIPSTDMSAAVQLALARANSALQDMAVMEGATAQKNGTKGAVPAPQTTDVDKFLKGDGTWATPSGGGGGGGTTDDVTVKLPSTIVPLGAVETGDLVSEAMAQVNNLVDAVDDLQTDKLNTNGDGSSVYATRGSASINYGDIPATDPVTLRELLRRLGGWYAEINSKYKKPDGGIPASDLASGVIPEKLVVTYTTTNMSTATCDKTYAEIITALQAKTPVEAYLSYGGGIVGALTTMQFGGTYVSFASTYSPTTNSLAVALLVHGSDNSVSISTLCPITPEGYAYDATPYPDAGDGYKGSSNEYSRGDHVHPTDTSRSPVVKYTTLTLATSDWSAVTGGYSCSKTVTGMTATSIVWLSYSDTETAITESQSANTLTFTVAALPSAAITVNVSFVEGVSL